MSISVVEKFQSRPATGGENAQTDLIFILRGSDDEIALKGALVASTPINYDGLRRKSWHVEQVGNELWEGTVRYAPQDQVHSDVGVIKLSVDTTGGSTHITQSLETKHKYAPPGKVAPDFKGAIGVTHDNVEGVDIIIPVFKFTATKVFAPAGLPDLGTLYDVTGKVNAGTFSVSDTVTGMTVALDECECLFNGAKIGEPRDDGNVEISYDFAASPNVTGLTVGDIVGIDKKGWEYLWVRYADVDDLAANVLVKRPIAAYVEKVYELGDFAGLGL
jgi:hypothetical protein